MFNVELRNLERKLDVKTWSDILVAVQLETIKVNLSGLNNYVECKGCKLQEKFLPSDSFIPFSVTVKGADGMMRSKLLKTNKEFLKFFIQTHLENCCQNQIRALALEKLDKKKAAN